MSISLITACMNRNECLQAVLPSWLQHKEITELIIVDWSSKEPLKHLTNLDSRIKVVRVEGEDFYVPSQANNLAASFATKEYLLRVDTDYFLNPYYNFFETYKIDNKTFVSGEPQNHAERKDNPYYMYLYGLLYISRENFYKVNGYNEHIGYYYSYEDGDMFDRLKLYGLEQIKLQNNHCVIHIPHPDKKRFENFEGGQITDWTCANNNEYETVNTHISINQQNYKDPKEFYVASKVSWHLHTAQDNYFVVSKTKNLLKDLPSINCISLEECENRREILTKQFKEYGIENINFLLSKRYCDSNDKIEGKFAHTLNEGTAGCCVSHLKNIKQWLEHSNEEYGFFCEDDLSLETIQYWKEPWQEFVNSLPNDWDCVQLLTVRQKDGLSTTVRERYWDDWGATAYILKRSYAKKIIDTYCINDTFKLELPEPFSNIQPLIENLLFCIGKAYAVALFAENISLKSTFVNADGDVSDETLHKNNHVIAATETLNLWKQNQIPGSSESCKYETISDLYNYATDVDNPVYNFKMGEFYFKQGHTAPALSYFLRCAERSDDKTLAYEALIYGYLCYREQKIRDETAKSLIMHAVCMWPERPEARWLLSVFFEGREEWMYAYYHANCGLETCDIEYPPLRSFKDYPGKCGLLYQKAAVGYWWGKHQECIHILTDLINNYVLPNDLKDKVCKLSEKVGIVAKFNEPAVIPVIGVPIVNGVQWLQRLINSIDYPVEQLFIINNNGRDQITNELNELSQQQHPFINKIKVVHLPSNLGVPGSWNLTIKCYMNSPYWMITNHDIEFPPGFLEKLFNKIKDNPDVGAFLGAEKQWDVFVLRDTAVQACGLFDENLYPAYVEDWDYLFRLNKQNIKWLTIDEPYLHGEKDYKTSGSQTWRMEQDLKDKLSFCRDVNELEYIAQKWGPQWLKDWHKDYSLTPWDYPFNNPDIPYTYTTYDLGFVRKKNLGF